MLHMKEQDKIWEEELSDVGIGNQPKKWFRVMIIKMNWEFRRKMDTRHEKLEVFKKYLENKKNK